MVTRKQAARGPRTAAPAIAATANGQVPAPAPADPRIGTARSEASLKLALQASQDGGRADINAFWAAWAKDGGQVIRSAGDFNAAASDADAAGDMMSRVVAVLTGTEGAVLAAGLSSHGRDLARALMAGAMDRFLGFELGGQLPGVPDGLALTVGYQITAEMLSAVAHNTGMLWVPSSDAKDYRVDNVRWDHPSHQFGSEDAAFDAWMAELLAWCDARRDGQSLRDHMLQPNRLTDLDSPDPRDVVREINRVEASFGVRPLVAALADHASSLVAQPGLRRRLATELRVDSVVVKLANGNALDLAIRRAETTVRRHMARLFDALHPKTQAPPPPSSRRTVFISYAHGDGARWMQDLQEQLQGLPDPDALDVWSDERIKTGDSWRSEIETAIGQAKCAVLVFTPKFLTSKFIKDVELPMLIQRHQSDGLKLFPLLGKACVWAHHPELNWIQISGANQSLEELAVLGQHTSKLVEITTEIEQLMRP